MTKRRGHGDGAIYRRKSDGKWVGSLDLGYVGGKRRRQVVYGETRREVGEKLTRLSAEHTSGNRVDAERLTLADYLELWLDSLETSGIRPRTLADYRSIARVRIIPRLGRLQLRKLRPLDLDAFYRDLATGGLKPRSIQNTRHMLHGALKQAVRWELIARNPGDAVSPTHAPRTDIHPLTRAQAEQLLCGVQDESTYSLYVLAITTGMRRGELLALHWRDVDLESGTLRVNWSVNRLRGELRLEAPKTETSRRTIHLAPLAVQALKRQHRVLAEQRLAAGPGWTDTGLVFPGTDGALAWPDAVSRRFQRTLRRLDLPRVRFHDLRHTAATLLLEQDTHPKVVSEMLGHASIRVTLDLYSHYIPALHEQAAATMERLFQGVAAS